MEMLSFTKLSCIKGFLVSVLRDAIINNRSFPLLRFRSALHCGYSGITDKDSGLE
jgi:hypothetical protein